MLVHGFRGQQVCEGDRDSQLDNRARAQFDRGGSVLQLRTTTHMT